MEQVQVIKGKRHLRGYTSREAAVRLVFYGTTSVDVTIVDNGKRLTVNVPRNELMHAVLGQITGDEVVNAHEDSATAGLVWSRLYRGFEG